MRTSSHRFADQIISATFLRTMLMEFPEDAAADPGRVYL